MAYTAFPSAFHDSALAPSSVTLSDSEPPGPIPEPTTVADSPALLVWPPSLDASLLYGASAVEPTQAVEPSSIAPRATPSHVPSSRKPVSTFICPYCPFTQTRQNVQRHVNRNHRDLLTDDDRAVFQATGSVGLVLSPDGVTRVDMCLACDCIPSNHMAQARARCIRRFSTGATAVDKRTMPARLHRNTALARRWRKAKAAAPVDAAAAALASIAYDDDVEEEPEDGHDEAGTVDDEHLWDDALSVSRDTTGQTQPRKRRREASSHESSHEPSAAAARASIPDASLKAMPDHDVVDDSRQKAAWVDTAPHTHTHVEAAAAEPDAAADGASSVTLNMSVPGPVLESLSRRCARLAAGERLVSVALICVDSQGRVSLVADSLAASSDMILAHTGNALQAAAAALPSQSPERFTMLSPTATAQALQQGMHDHATASPSMNGMDDDVFVSWEVLPLHDNDRDDAGPVSITAAFSDMRTASLISVPAMSQ